MALASTFPEQVVTGRLDLHPYDGGDTEELLNLVTRNRESLRESFASMAHNLSSVKEVLSFIEAKREEWRERSRFCYGIFHRNSGVLLGQIQIKNLSWQIPAAELSYFISCTHHGMGFATEAVQGILEVAFSNLNFRRITLRIIARNAPSIRLAEKLGFQLEGIHRSEFRCGNGMVHDVHHYATINNKDHC